MNLTDKQSVQSEGQTLCFICHEVVCPTDKNTEIMLSIQMTNKHLIDYRRGLQKSKAKSEMVKQRDADNVLNKQIQHKASKKYKSFN